MPDFEKELAVLKGRVDGLEAKVGEFEALLGRGVSLHNSSVLVMDVYDVQTEEIKKSSKVIRTNRWSAWRRFSGDNSFVFVSHSSAILFSNSNTTGNWPLLKFTNTGETNPTGKTIFGAPSYDEKNWRNVGVIPSPQGSWFVVNKQDLI